MGLFSPSSNLVNRYSFQTSWLRPTERSAPSRPTTRPQRLSTRGCQRCLSCIMKDTKWMKKCICVSPPLVWRMMFISVTPPACGSKSQIRSFLELQTRNVHKACPLKFPPTPTPPPLSLFPSHVSRDNGDPVTGLLLS